MENIVNLLEYYLHIIYNILHSPCKQSKDSQISSFEAFVSLFGVHGGAVGRELEYFRAQQ
jgi:hypothetical protein